MVDALRDLNAGRIAVYGSYYTRPWIEMTAKRFEDFGFEVALAASSSDLGLVPELASIDQHETASAPKVVSEGLRRIAAEYPHLEAIAIPGSGVRTAAYIEAIEAELDLPIVPADLSVYWAIAKELDLTFPLVSTVTPKPKPLLNALPEPPFLPAYFILAAKMLKAPKSTSQRFMHHQAISKSLVITQ